jgi:hypothetical protein
MPNGSRADLTGNAQQKKEQINLEQKNDNEHVNVVKTTRVSKWSKVYDGLAYVPLQCRYDPIQPFQFSIGLNLLFGNYVLRSFKYDLR